MKGGLLGPTMLCVAALVGVSTYPGCRRENYGPTESIPSANRPTARPVVAVRITGHDYQWHVRYAGPDGVLETADDVLGSRHLYLPAYAQIRLELCSDDFAYSLYLPHQDLMEVAIPDQPCELEFQTDAPGTYELLGSQMCGYTHPLLIGTVKVGDDLETK